jgi:2-keto-3-deoxy-L-rhamnonate aldolase RhmA
VEAIDKLTAAARKHNKVLACMTASEAWSKEYWDRGFRLFAVGVDSHLLQGAIRQGIGALQTIAGKKTPAA